MRIIIRGRTKPANFAHAVRDVFDRLDYVGVENLPGINIYLTAFADGEELHIIDEKGDCTDVLQIWLPSADSRDLQQPSRGAIVRLKDIPYFHSFTDFAASLRMSREQRCELLGVTDDRLKHLEQNPLQLELSAQERSRLSLLGRTIAAAEELAADWDDAIAWFSGTGRHASRDGSTPLGQMEIGGAETVESICSALELMARRKRLGFAMSLPASDQVALLDDSDEGA